MREPLANPRDEAYAQALAMGAYPETAYRECYGDQSRSVTTAAYMKRITKAVAERTRYLRVQAALEDVYSPIQALRDWLAIARADPRELTEIRRGACRHCHGDGHEYQWKEHEFMRAYAEAEARGEKPPPFAGGMGYLQTADPHPNCPECEGQGLPRVEIKDTQHLTPDGLLLFEGVKETRNGIEIKMKDRAKALENAARIIGAFNDKLDLGDSAAGLAEAVANLANMKPDEASRHYMDIAGTKH